MNKKLIIGAAIGLAVAGAIAATKSRSSATPRPTFFEKMQEHMEQMPEDFPPRVMYDNVEATRANTERILELLHRDAPETPGAVDEDIEVLQTT